jgi:hypothetical protein
MVKFLGGDHNNYQCEQKVVRFGNPGEKEPHIRKTKKVAEGDHRYLLVNGRIDQKSQGKSQEIDAESYPERIVVQ